MVHNCQGVYLQGPLYLVPPSPTTLHPFDPPVQPAYFPAGIEQLAYHLDARQRWEAEKAETRAIELHHAQVTTTQTQEQ